MGRKRVHVKKGMPPLCGCGCRQPVHWSNGKGWAKYVVGHNRKGRNEKQEWWEKLSASLRKHYAGKRNRDLEEVPGTGVYATWEYREARERLVKGRACLRCGTMEDVCSHHVIPGDDASIIPLCRRCHPTIYATPGAKGQEPPPGEAVPMCACGCGLPVAWKRVRGWAKYRKGHWGAKKVPAGTCLEKPPLCGCGCGQSVKFTFGKGWNKYKRGHGQRVEGHYKTKNKRP